METVKLLRIGISIVLILLIIAGLVLASIPATRSSPVGILQQQSLCQNTINRTIDPYHDFTISCAVSRDAWSDLSLTSTLPIALDVSFARQPTGAPVLLYKQSGTKITGHIPFFSEGSVIFNVMNSGNATTLVTGSLSTSNLKNVTGYIGTTIYPNRTGALALIGVSGVLLFVIGWDPRGIATSMLRKVTRWKPREKHEQQPPSQASQRGE